MSMLHARSPRYPALYDPASGVVFSKGRAVVTEEQALLLAERRHVDGILLVDVDDEGRPVSEQHVKEWARDRRRADSTELPATPEPQDPDLPPAEVPEPKTRKAR